MRASQVHAYLKEINNMAHGNKKYFFEQLKKEGDTLLVKPTNIYSLKSNLNLYIKANDPSMKVEYEDQRGGKVLITRVA